MILDNRCWQQFLTLNCSKLQNLIWNLYKPYLQKHLFTQHLFDWWCINVWRRSKHCEDIFSAKAPRLQLWQASSVACFRGHCFQRFIRITCAIFTTALWRILLITPFSIWETEAPKSQVASSYHDTQMLKLDF